MQALENNNTQQDDWNIIKYRSQNGHRWRAFETNARLSFYLYKILYFDAVVCNLLSAVHSGKFVNSADANK
jgi:hypothetical protein